MPRSMPQKKTALSPDHGRRAVGYIRVSTEEQASEGVSLAAQEDRLRDYCRFVGLELVEVFRDEGESGGTPLGQRTAGGRLLAALERGEAGNIVAMRLDRLFRDAIDCMQRATDWEAAGVALHLLDMGGQAVDTRSAAGRFMLHVLAAAAEMQRNRIRENTREALAQLKKQGRRLGTTPLGFVTPEPGAPMVVDPEGLEAVAFILRARGERPRPSYARIAERLTEAGFATKRGRRWHPETVRKVVEGRDRYRGFLAEAA